MSAQRLENTYYIKNTRGKYVLLSEASLIAMIKSKELKPNSKVFSNIYHTWMKVSDLSIFKNLSRLIDLSKLDSQEQADLVDGQNSNEDFNIDEQFVHLLDQVEDAKEIIFKARFEKTEQVHALEKLNQELKDKIHQQELTLDSLQQELRHMKEENLLLHGSVKNLSKELKQQSSTTEQSKIIAENNKLKQQLKIAQLDKDNEVSLSNHMILQIEGLKKELFELYERKEFHEVQYKKIEKEKIYFSENLRLYQDEVETLNLEKRRLQEHLASISQKYSLAIEEKNQSFEKFADIEDKVPQLQKQIKELEHRLSEVEELRDQTLAEKEKIEIDIVDLAQENKASQSENEHLRNQLEKTKKINAEMELELQQMKMIPPMPDDAFIKNLLAESRKIDQQKIDESNKKVALLETELLELKEKTTSKVEFQKIAKRLAYFENAYNVLFEKSKTIAKKWQMKSKEFDDLKSILEQFKKENIVRLNTPPKIDNAGPTIKSTSAKPVIEMMTELPSHSAEAKKVDDHQKMMRKAVEVNPLLLDDENIGNLFEVSNVRNWKVNDKKFQDKIYTIFELQKMIEDKELSSSVKVKVPGKPWKAISEVFELNTKMISKEVDGKLKFFIERKCLRIPVHYLAKVNSDKAEKGEGICANISLTGCLVIFKTLPDFVIIGTSIELTIQLPNEKKSLEFKCNIMNVKEENNLCFVGVQFSDPSEEAIIWISRLMTEFMDTQSF